MSIIDEVEDVIAQLPPEEASKLKHLLNGLEATRRYKHIKAYIMANHLLADFKKSKGNALDN